MRQYEQLWTDLKVNGTARIVAHKAFHARIIKAIWKEKHMDLAFKQECLETGKRFRNNTTITGSVIEFTMELRPLYTTDAI